MLDLLENLEQVIPSNMWCSNWLTSKHQEGQRRRGFGGGRRRGIRYGMRGGYRGRRRVGNGRRFHQPQCDELEVPQDK